MKKHTLRLNAIVSHKLKGALCISCGCQVYLFLVCLVLNPYRHDTLLY